MCCWIHPSLGPKLSSSGPGKQLSTINLPLVERAALSKVLPLHQEQPPLSHRRVVFTQAQPALRGSEKLRCPPQLPSSQQGSAASPFIQLLLRLNPSLLIPPQGQSQERSIRNFLCANFHLRIIFFFRRTKLQHTRIIFPLQPASMLLTNLMVGNVSADFVLSHFSQPFVASNTKISFYKTCSI